MPVITLKRSKKDELTHLEHIEEVAFAVNSRYFENGVLPPFSEEERTACTLAASFERDDAAVFSIYADNERLCCFFLHRRVKAKAWVSAP